MNNELKKNIDYILECLGVADKYEHACHVLNFDMETICPEKSMEEQGEIMAFLSNKAFQVIKEDAFIQAEKYVFDHMDQLDGFEKVMAETLKRDYDKTKNMTSDFNHRITLARNKAFVNWMSAKKEKDFSKFQDSLGQVVELQKQEMELREDDLSIYDRILSDYDRGMTVEKIDEAFDSCKERLIPLLKEIMASQKEIRTDFLTRKVTEEAQKEMATYLLETIGFDFTRGNFSTTEHPFTDTMGKNDTRITTNYENPDITANLYTVVHEGGHALFDMNQPRENFKWFITENKTMGQHESVSRFYENRIGRSRGFIHYIYPKMKEILKDALYDVTEEEFYAAVNRVQPDLIRTEADEFTYTFHVIIRYEVEKAVASGQIGLQQIPQLWADKYEEYLGVRPADDAEGCLQDVHWTQGFGYFPSYALGNMYNAMYYNTMEGDFDIEKAASEGDFEKINGWMIDHVFAKADRLDSAQWIEDITGREFTADDFLDYIEEKYRRIYGI